MRMAHIITEKRTVVVVGHVVVRTRFYVLGVRMRMAHFITEKRTVVHVVGHVVVRT